MCTSKAFNRSLRACTSPINYPWYRKLFIWKHQWHRNKKSTHSVRIIHRHRHRQTHSQKTQKTPQGSTHTHTITKKNWQAFIKKKQKKKRTQMWMSFWLFGFVAADIVIIIIIVHICCALFLADVPVSSLAFSAYSAMNKKWFMSIHCPTWCLINCNRIRSEQKKKIYTTTKTSQNE